MCDPSQMERFILEWTSKNVKYDRWFIADGFLYEKKKKKGFLESVCVHWSIQSVSRETKNLYVQATVHVSELSILQPFMPPHQLPLPICFVQNKKSKK